MAGKPWSVEEDNFLKENFLNMTCAQIANRIKRTTRAVQHRYNFLKLQMPLPKLGEDKWNRLLLLETHMEYRYGQQITIGKFQCDCGNITFQKITAVKNSVNPIKSCGCLKRELAAERCRAKATHKESNKENNRLFRIWCGMKARCYIKSAKGYENYGGRGITVCDEWRNDYTTFRDWALANGYQDHLTIDRIEGNKGYYPDNCRWSTYLEQNNNQRGNRLLTAFGETKTISQWTRDSRCQSNGQTIIYRVFKAKNKWKPETAISTPPLIYNRCYGEPK
jgi:hypothetical protein